MLAAPSGQRSLPRRQSGLALAVLGKLARCSGYWIAASYLAAADSLPEPGGGGDLDLGPVAAGCAVFVAATVGFAALQLGTCHKGCGAHARGLHFLAVFRAKVVAR